MKRICTIMTGSMLLLSAAILPAVPAAKLWPYWRALSVASSMSIDHSQWGFFGASCSEG
jgi:hypothetical protein